MTRSAAELFNEARELPADQRASFLAGACGKDAALRAKVEALLKADAEAGGFMTSPTAGSAARAHASTSQEQAGAQIDRYKLLEQIGEGGMGTIWMAEQREPVKRRVALKIIKLGMDTKQVIARFEAERQALALMDHPHIAKVLDAGATDTGRPYFVMEYIKGIPILEYCDKERLDTTARLALFTSVCHAIQHAHQKGIIHRDIKPSNVLVTLHDGVPVPKVIDFGIAKATNSELTAKTLFTEHRQMIGTPAYMSPEQAELSGLDIDTRSDIYSLGVLLYELLTGTTPFDTKALLESGLNEMLRAIREDEPHKPSTRISSLGDTGTRTAQQRKVDLKKLSTLLRGDLDWIVMKCLEKDRTRRYDTANGLAADIRRHLSDEPVTAGAPSAGYKLRKFVKRNRKRVIAACLVLMALLLAIVGTSWGLVEKSRARSAQLQRTGEDEQRTASENARLQRNAEAVSSFLAKCEDALRAGDPAKAWIALDAARKRSGEGGAENDAGRFARLGADLDLSVALDAIDQFRWAWGNDDFGSLGDVAARMRKPLEKFGADPEKASVESAAALANASAVRERIVAALDWQLWSRRSKEVHALLRRLDDDPFRNEVRDTILRQDNPGFVVLMKRPAALEQPPEFAAFVGEFEEVEQSRRVEMLQAAALRRPKDLRVLMALQRNRMGDMREWLRWCQAAVAAAPTNVPAYGNLGLALMEGGRLDDAIACFQRAIELDPDATPSHTNLANALELTGRFEASLASHRRAIELDPEGFENYCCLGSTLSRMGRLDEALVAMRKAVEHEPKHAEAHYNIGLILQTQGKSAEAIDAFKKVIEFTPKNPEGWGNIGVALRNLGRLDESVRYFEKALEHRPKDARFQSNLGGVLCQLGRTDEAIAMLKRAAESDPKYPMSYYNLGKAYAKDKRMDEAIAAFKKAIECDPNYAEPHCDLSGALRELGALTEALAEAKRCHELGSKRSDWSYPSADWIRSVEEEIAQASRLEPLLPALLKGEYQPRDNAERVQFAFLCENRKQNYAALGLFAEALAADPEVGASIEGSVHYNAAIVAALSADGQGKDAPNLSDAERARLRKLAGDWLRADLNEARRRFEANAADGIVPLAMRNYLYQAEFASIRDPAALAKLPADEQQAFTQLWTEMAALLKQAQAPKARTGGAEAPLVENVEQALISLNNQGMQFLSEGKLAEAEQVLAEGVGACRRAFAAPHPITAILLHHHAEGLRQLARFDDALSEARAAVDMCREHVDWPFDESTHAVTVLVSILMDQGRPDQALAARREWVAVQRQLLPPRSAELANQVRVFSEDLLKRGTLETAREAETMLRECLDIRSEVMPKSWLVPSARSQLGGSILHVVELDTALTPEVRAARMSEAERLLLDAHAEMQDNPTVPTPAQTGGADRRREALERVVRLYELWNRIEPEKDHDAQAAEWRKALDAPHAPTARGNK